MSTYVTTCTYVFKDDNPGSINVRVQIVWKMSTLSVDLRCPSANCTLNSFPAFDELSSFKKKKFPTKEVSLRQSVFALLYSKCRSHTPVCKASRSSSQTHLGSFWWSWTSSQSCALSLKVLTAADTIYEEYFKSVPAYLHTLFSDKPQVKWSWLVHF